MGRRAAKRVLMLLGIALMLSACDFARGFSTENVAVNDDGQLVVQHQNNDGLRTFSPPGQFNFNARVLSDSVTGGNQQREIELADGTAIRLVNQRAIEESTDGFETFEVVWQVDPDAGWWRGDTYAPIPGVFDLVALPDGSAAAAAGTIGVLERSPDGTWTPSVADLRTLPLFTVALVLAGALVFMVAAIMAFGPLTHGRGSAKAATILIPPFVLASTWTFNTVDFGADFLTILTFPFAAQSLGTSIGSLIRSKDTPNYLPALVKLTAALGALLVGVFATLYVLWSRDLLSYRWAVQGCAIATVLVPIVGAYLLRRQVGTQPLPPAPNIVESSWSKAIVLGYVLPPIVGIPLTAISALFIAGDSGLVPVESAVFPWLLVIALAGLPAYLIPKADYSGLSVKRGDFQILEKIET